MKQLFLTFRTCLLLVLTCATTPSSAQLNQLAGYTKLEAITDEDGRARIYVPLNLPKGTFVEPSLALSYNSQGGIDWSLGDLFQAITRAPSTYAQDGFSRGIEMDRHDRFSINHERMVANFCCTNAASGYLTLATDFRTEQEVFTRIVPHVSFKDGAYVADSFTVYTKTGLIMQFGGSINSKLRGIWLVNRITDKNGNYLTIGYTTNLITNEYQPAFVEYTGNYRTGLKPYNKIVFQYENRPDVVSKYFAGYRSTNTKRLTAIIAYDHNILYRLYKLEYLPNSASSRLHKITEYGSDGISYLKPIVISWTTQPAMPAFTKTGSGNWVGNTSVSVANLLGDFTGDSRTDIITYQGNSRYNMSISNGQRFLNEVWTGNAGGTANIVADVNGDLRSDLVFVSNNRFYVSISTGKGFVTTEWTGGNAAGTGNFVVGDFNNDARADLCRNGGGGKFILNISTGNGFRAETRTTNYTGFTGTPLVSDLNADGSSDIFFSQGTGTGNWQIMLSSGNSYWSDMWKGPLEDMTRCLLADMNGDNNMDIVSKASSTDGNWNIFFGTGRGFFQERWAGPVGSITDFRIADINKNGFPDVVRKTSASAYQVGLNKGYGFDIATWQGPAANGTNFTLIDADGDGGTDVLNPVSGTTWSIGLANAERDFVTKVTNGNGQDYLFTYAPLTDATVYTMGTNATYPVVDVGGPYYVVRSVATENGAGGLRTINFHYRNSKFHLLGRGFRGFEQVSRTDALANTVLTNFYSTDHRLIAVRTLKEELRTTDGKLLHLIENQTSTVSYKLPVDSAWFSYYSKKTERSYELNGLLYSSKTTDYVVDVFGNPTSISETWGDGYRVVTNKRYYNDIFSWSIGRLLETVIVSTMPGFASSIRNSIYLYDADGNLKREVLLPADATRRQQTDYTVDKYGNPISSTISGPRLAARTTVVYYDADGRNPVSTRNPMGHITQTSYKNGMPALLTNENGLGIGITVDAAGRETHRLFPDGTYQFTQYKNCVGQNCPTAAVYYVEEQSPGKATRWKYYDLMDRIILKATEHADGRKVMVAFSYNTDGTVKAQSDPYFEGSGNIRWTTYTYDAIKRVITETSPGNRVTRYAYNGLTKTITDPEGRKRTVTENQQGKPVVATDNAGKQLLYTYDSELNLVKLAGPKGYVVTFTYDVLGFKTSITDPDLGTYRYECDALGNLVRQTNAANEVIAFEYDLLNRVSRQVEPGVDYRFEYDAPNSKPNLAKIFVNNVLAVSKSYHPNGKLYQHVFYNNGQAKPFTYFYNSFSGLTERVIYPNNFSTSFTYTKGYLLEIKNAMENTSLWKARTYNEEMHLSSFQLGNGLITNRKYDELTRFLTGIQTGSAAVPGSIQNLQFIYSATGSLTERRDLAFNLKENFQYDDIGRLIKAQVTGQAALTMAYDELDNIIYKSDVGNYKYAENGMGVHTLTSIDHNGINCAKQLQQDVTYTAFNYVSRIRTPESDIRFSYWPDRSRQSMSVRKGGAVKIEKTYYGDLFEETKDSTGAVTATCFIKANDEVFATVSKRGMEAQQTTYIHTDHLGSVNVCTAVSGQVLERMSFDAWGRKRNPQTWQPLTSPTALRSFQRGFTMHEMLSVDELVFMPGRIYSPLLGRFISADPFVQDITSLPHLNRFAYVLNNPLSYTDATGYFSFKKFFKKIIGPLVGLVAMTVALPVSGFVGAILSGATSGFATAFTATLVNGGGLGNALKAGLTGALWNGIKEGLTFGIGVMLPLKEFAKTPFTAEIRAVIHGVSQGAINHAQGGSFGQGFARGFISENIRYARDEFVRWRLSPKYGNLSDEQLEQSKATYRVAQDYPEGWKDNFDLISKTTDDPIRGLNYPNVGKFPVDPAKWYSENSSLMMGLAKNVAGLNSMAVAHDLFALAVERGDWIDNITNGPTIPIFAAIQMAALHTSQYNHGRIY